MVAADPEQVDALASARAVASQCAPVRRARLPAILVLLLVALTLPACERHPAAALPPPPPALRQLNELSIPQLRTFLKGYPGDWRVDSDRSQQRPAPPAEKPLPDNAKRIALTPRESIHLGELSLREAIANRRSTRDFTDAPLTLEQLSFLLWATQGVTGVRHDEATGEIAERYRAAPSAGARYPLETYLAIRRVEGLAPGLYRYLPNDHQLTLLRESPTLADELQAACYGAPLISQAAVVFLWTAIPYRTEWKYTYISHRMIAMEAGHVCENLYLAATAGGLGACGVMAYHQPLVDALLGVDGQDEFTLYLAGVGQPRETPAEK